MSLPLKLHLLALPSFGKVLALLHLGLLPKASELRRCEPPLRDDGSLPVFVDSHAGVERH